MRSYKRLVPPPNTQSSKITFIDLIRRLKKEPIDYEEFLKLLEKCTDKSFEDSQLEFELLLINGFPLDIIDDFVYLKTNNTKIEEQTFCIVDIETNGGTPKKGHQIIELGAVKYRNGEIIDKFNSLVFAKDIPIFVQEVTNISVDMLKDAPRLDKVLQEFKLFLADDVFVAHDIKFDYNFISDSFEIYNLGKLLNRKICTIDLAKRTIKSEKYGLSTLKELLNIDVNNHHRAYFDALTTSKIFEKSILNIDRNSVKTVEDLISFSKSNNILK
ncbi:3'-5' exonuclease [Arcobacter porcinus]|uniref:DNA polymerase III PolC-type n=1 Tax=Arcobacter porcinus TaxID=1935204 RepID=A0ABX2YHE1_9BACT|nr:3'-5' exonuclease [Arcobacter porcinus]OCL82864.1 DNA polymerase III PolC-type [Arcobacter porcinus]OCL85031.1 DNA polymerase III PolC-type [Arcobacter porcinus]OCL86581.1 DNA polymerase III PolC-type [Arcobacter porcinus]OCL93083.1 DNA polymerase III PolC-type [Arcobacter porcinus]